MIEELQTLSKKIKEYASIIKQENKRLELLVEKVLQVAQLNKSEFVLEKEDSDIHQIILNCINSFEIIINNQNGIIKTDMI